MRGVVTTGAGLVFSRLGSGIALCRVGVLRNFWGSKLRLFRYGQFEGVIGNGGLGGVRGVLHVSDRRCGRYFNVCFPSFFYGLRAVRLQRFGIGCVRVVRFPVVCGVLRRLLHYGVRFVEGLMLHWLVGDAFRRFCVYSTIVASHGVGRGASSFSNLRMKDASVCLVGLSGWTDAQSGGSFLYSFILFTA